MSAPAFRAITTRYKGYNFRSRLEARWAVFFDHLGIRWDYEPEGFELGNGLRYLPDFWLPDWKMWVEVKPAECDVAAAEKALRLAKHGRYPVFVSNGMPMNGGTLFTATSNGPDLQGACEVDWAARDGNFIWLFTDKRKPDEGYHCWGGAEVFTCLPSRKGMYTPGAPEALEAARGARFEFGAKGEVR